MSGTNWHDRRIGAGGIVRKLVASGAIGLITTHDLALSEIEQDLETAAANVHFDDQIVDGQIDRAIIRSHLSDGALKHARAIKPKSILFFRRNWFAVRIQSPDVNLFETARIVRIVGHIPNLFPKFVCFEELTPVEGLAAFLHQRAALVGRHYSWFLPAYLSGFFMKSG